MESPAVYRCDLIRTRCTPTPPQLRGALMLHICDLLGLQYHPTCSSYCGQVLELREAIGLTESRAAVGGAADFPVLAPHFDSVRGAPRAGCVRSRG